ncbi:MAG TPA: hypothetical protein VJT71_13140, partial [Pyrinomonadaceae bacterium]|nr:hypothetical protein [Pyrinomonadaceae bacterium]
MANILIVYYYKNEYPLRATTADHLYSFQEYSKHNCFYLNVATRGLPSYLKKVAFDLIVFHTIFLSARWDRTLFKTLLREVSALKDSGAVKVALPQDEFLNTDLLCDFVNDFDIDHVFSVAPESEWEVIYPTVDRQRVKFTKVLTGYLDAGTLEKITRLSAQARPRTIDVGYRAWRGAAWLGRHGFLKSEIADVFSDEAPKRGLVADISTRSEDTLFGDAWYEFLLQSKYIIGVEGGASILDRDGSIRAKTEAYVSAHESAGFDEVEANCFPNMEGSLKLFAISPRHLEACATRTCQVLIEGEYNGILKAGRHYIELKRDFSNIGQVLDSIKRDHLRSELTAWAYQDIVESKLYTYQSFVEMVLAQSLGTETKPIQDRQPGPQPLVNSWMRIADRLSWIAVAFNWYIVVPIKRRLRKFLVKLFPDGTAFFSAPKASKG